MGLVIQGVLRFKVCLGFCLIMSMEMPFLPFFKKKKVFHIIYIYIKLFSPVIKEKNYSPSLK